MIATERIPAPEAGAPKRLISPNSRACQRGRENGAEVRRRREPIAIPATPPRTIASAPRPAAAITTEAIALYKKHLGPNGIIAFHVSNQYLNLAPEIAQLAIAANMQSRLIESAAVDLTGSYRSTWVLLTNSPDFFSRPQIASASMETPTTPRLHPWTDEYSSLLPIVQLTKH